MALGKIKIFIIVTVVLIVSAIVSFFAAITVSANPDIIYPGVRVEDIELGQLSKAEATDKLDELNRQIGEMQIQVNAPTGVSSFKLSDIGANINVKEIVEKAWNYGHEGNIIRQWQERKRIAREGVRLPVKINFSKEKFIGVANRLGKDAVLEPKDAKLVITPDDKVEIVAGQDGKVIDIDNALVQLGEILDEITRDNSNHQINLALKVIKPKKTTEDIANMSINGIIARYSTFFNAQKTNRVYNIKVAAEALNGQFVEPGQTFSFNKVVGPRSEEAGYKLAPAILNNEFIDSLGGGVCQVSTTLYNTLLLAHLEIVERSNHSLLVSYVPPGQDAAVAYGGKDLKFKNNLPCWIFLKTEVVGNRITVKIFGDTAFKKDIRISNNIVKTYPFKVINKDDSTIPKGQKIIKQKGVNGYKVTSKLNIYNGGKLISSENLRSSTYKPLDQIVLNGTKKTTVSTKPQKPKDDEKGNRDAPPPQGDDEKLPPGDPTTTDPSENKPREPGEPNLGGESNMDGDSDSKNDKESEKFGDQPST